MAQDKVFFQTVGNVGKDPVTKTLPSGDEILTFSLAVSNGYGNSFEGIPAPQPSWYDVTVWKPGLQAVVLEAIYKGGAVAVEGTLTTREANGNTYRDVRASKVGTVTWLRADAAAAPAKEW